MKVGIIGGGLMGREAASALGRWFAVSDVSIPVPELVAVCDISPSTLEWYRRVPTVRLLTGEYRELLADPEIDIVYVAVPHNLHEEVYCAVLDSGKDLFAEKPFGIDLSAAERIQQKVRQSRRFARVSSEFPFYPIVHRAMEIVNEGIGVPIEGRCAFSHSSDLDPNKPINWKRQVASCGQIGVMGDLGMHVFHFPHLLGIRLQSVFAQLQNLVPARPDGAGGMAPCDTWDNARLHCQATLCESEFPFSYVTRRIAPGEMNTWEFELLGTRGGVRVSTKHPKTVWLFSREGGEQRWTATDVGTRSAFKTITGDIFEFGFSDAILQMWAGFAAERGGVLDGRLGCAPPEIALESHRLFDAAIRSHEERRAIPLSR